MSPVPDLLSIGPNINTEWSEYPSAVQVSHQSFEMALKLTSAVTITPTCSCPSINICSIVRMFSGRDIGAQGPVRAGGRGAGGRGEEPVGGGAWPRLHRGLQ